MTDTEKTQAPEFATFIQYFAIGFLLAELFWSSYHLGYPLGQALESIWKLPFTICITVFLWAYAKHRELLKSCNKLRSSLRIDLLALALLGAWANHLALKHLSVLNEIHTTLNQADPSWAVIVLASLLCMIVSSLLRSPLQKLEVNSLGTKLLSDEAIKNQDDDLLGCKTQVEEFANAVTRSGIHQSLVFGVDGPWGIGKTSFVNMAEKIWEKQSNVITCRFEPLRYNWEPFLTVRLIQEISRAVHEHAFVPELRPATSQLTQLLKGKPKISLFGLKISLTPSKDDIDELLNRIDQILKQNNLYLVIVIDDLDRLDSKTCDSVLFATRQVLKLSRAAYVLCYDMEVLVKRKEEGFVHAREFLEKFVDIKFNLFVSSSSISDLLKYEEWRKLIPPNSPATQARLRKLKPIFNHLSDLLTNKKVSAQYLPLLGSMRKLKHFINAMLSIQLEKTDLGQTDFDPGDLINLMLLHLNYPGVFRQIHAEETEGRNGFFSLKYNSEKREYLNHSQLDEFIKQLDDEPAKFLLRQLFDAQNLNSKKANWIEAQSEKGKHYWSRACLNHDPQRNLEKYLKLIVKFEPPLPQNTRIFFRRAFEQIKSGTGVKETLNQPEFDLTLTDGEKTHDQFWRFAYEWWHELELQQLDDVIYTLIDYLPRYPVGSMSISGQRYQGVHDLSLFLDKSALLAGETTNYEPIAHRIFGEANYSGKSIIQLLGKADRGVLGWQDLMLFRSDCKVGSSRLPNIFSSLIKHQTPDEETHGNVRDLNLLGIRKLSQEIFALFKQTFIKPKRNFFAEVAALTDQEILGDIPQHLLINETTTEKKLASQLAALRSMIQIFVIYQLSRNTPVNESDIQCGFFDEEGSENGGGISQCMNDYVFNVCFNPEIDESNALMFFDYCLSNLNTPFYPGSGAKGFFPTKEKITSALDPRAMTKFWLEHKDVIKPIVNQNPDREVITHNYTTTYAEQCDAMYKVLDELAKNPSEDTPQ